MITFRPAQESDLAQMYDVFYQNEIKDTLAPPPPGNIPSYLRHVLQTGTIYVAEQDGHVLAFAGAITRGSITFLTDLFVHPGEQSRQLGKMLLEYVLPRDGLIHCTMSSTDPRALALYIRAGMRPQWPNFCLRLDGSLRNGLLITDVEAIEGHSDDPEFVQWDARISGRSRPVDHIYWLHTQHALPLWFRRSGEVVGYGYVRLGVGTLWYPDVCVLGPIGAHALKDATACVLAAVHWAQERAGMLRIDVPGPHPCLALLLDGGFHITYVETFVSSASSPFFDARCYITSGSDLF